MTGTRHLSDPILGRRTFVVSVLALLALACLPALARADSSGVQYSDAPPTVTGGKVPKNQEPPAKTSTTDNGGGSSQQGGGSSKSSHSSETGGSPGGSSSGSGGGSGSPGGGGGAESGGQGKPAQGSAPPGTSTGSLEPASTKSGGGSSPLVPILIAIAVLAAISVGVVMWRRRRDAAGASVSPKAG